MGLTQPLMVPSAPSPPHREAARHILKGKRKKKQLTGRLNLELSEVLDSNNVELSGCHGNVSRFQSNPARGFYMDSEACGYIIKKLTVNIILNN